MLLLTSELYHVLFPLRGTLGPSCTPHLINTPQLKTLLPEEGKKLLSLSTHSTSKLQLFIKCVIDILQLVFSLGRLLLIGKMFLMAAWVVEGAETGTVSVLFFALCPQREVVPDIHHSTVQFSVYLCIYFFPLSNLT